MLDRFLAFGWQMIAQVDPGTTDSAAAAVDGGTRVALLEMLLNDGGWTMYVLIALSAIGVCMTLYFLLTLRFGMLMPTDFRREAESVAAAGDTEGLREVCSQNRSPGARVIGAAANLLYDDPKAEYLMIRDIIEGEGSRQTAALWQRIQYLMDIAVVAPMIGLLGTVLGMMQAFVGLRENFRGATPAALADGVSKALITTAGGLVVGIIAMMIYSYFRGRVNRLITQMEESCGQILQRYLIAQHSRRSASAPPVAQEKVATRKERPEISGRPIVGPGPVAPTPEAKPRPGPSATDV